MSVNKLIFSLIFIPYLISCDKWFPDTEKIINSLKPENIFKNVIEKITNDAPQKFSDAFSLNPTVAVTNMIETGRQMILGTPFDVMSTTLHDICAEINSVNKWIAKIQTPTIDSMSFLLMTSCQNFSIPLLKANDMIKLSAFDINKKLVILATGWTTNINDTGTIYAIAKAYLCRGDVNFIALDTAKYVDTLYTWSALNTQEIGKNLAIGLVKLAEIVPVKNIHLIGHSLGAHIVGSAGRNFYKKTKKLIPRITGLDPAKPCFKKNDNIVIGLNKNDGEFVDVIHTNPDVLGIRENIGHIDFYPGGLNAIFDNCLLSTCSHNIVWEYYSESVYPDNENKLIGRKCNSWRDLEKKNCWGNIEIMGYNANENISGIFYWHNNDKNQFQMNGIHGQCGLCLSEVKETFYI